jgi:hypothetical protein
MKYLIYFLPVRNAMVQEGIKCSRDYPIGIGSITEAVLTKQPSLPIIDI